MPRATCVPAYILQAASNAASNAASLANVVHRVDQALRKEVGRALSAVGSAGGPEPDSEASAGVGAGAGAAGAGSKRDVAVRLNLVRLALLERVRSEQWQLAARASARLELCEPEDTAEIDSALVALAVHDFRRGATGTTAPTSTTSTSTTNTTATATTTTTSTTSTTTTTTTTSTTFTTTTDTSTAMGRRDCAP